MSTQRPFPELEDALLARHGRREGREIRFCCPAHEDEHPSARWNAGKQGWFCDVCGAGGGREDLLGRLGLRPAGARGRRAGDESGGRPPPPAPAAPPPPPPPPPPPRPPPRP